MRSNIDVLLLRRPKWDYVSPAVCDVDFSSSSSPVIVLEDISKLRAPSGLILGGAGGFRLSWNAYPTALCFSIYKAVDCDNPNGDYEILAECVQDTFYDLPDGVECYYRVTAITPDGESDPSDTVHTSGSGGGCPPIAWWAMEDVTDGATVDYLIYDEIDTIPAKLHRTGAIRNAPTGAIGKGLYVIDCANFPDNAAWSFDAGHSATPSLLPVNLADGCAFSFDFTNFAPSSTHFISAYTQFELRDSSNAILGYIMTMIHSVPIGSFPPGPPIPGSPNLDSGPGLYVWCVDAGGAITYQTFIAQSISDTGYHNLVVNYGASGGTIDIWLDGVKVAIGNLSASFTGVCDNTGFLIQPFLVSGIVSPGTAYIYFDELSIWPCKLTDTLAAKFWNGGAFQTWPMV